MSDNWWIAFFGLAAVALNNVTTLLSIWASRRNAASLAQLHDCVDTNHQETLAAINEVKS